MLLSTARSRVQEASYDTCCWPRLPSAFSDSSARTPGMPTNSPRMVTCGATGPSGCSRITRTSTAPAWEAPKTPETGGYKARCLSQTWKRMKMRPGGGILGGGASETRSWRFGAASPIRKLIPVRFPDE
jgi:hypothetical protein